MHEGLSVAIYQYLLHDPSVKIPTYMMLCSYKQDPHALYIYMYVTAGYRRGSDVHKHTNARIAYTMM